MDSRKLKELSESDIQKQILHWLNVNGIFSFRINNAGIYDAKAKAYRKPGLFSLAGISDILGIVEEGRLLAIEVKSKKGRVSKEQIAFIDKVNRKGGLAFVAYSLEDVIKKLG